MLHVVQDGVLSKGGGLEEVEHGAGNKDGVEAVPFPGKEAAKERSTLKKNLPNTPTDKTHS